MISLLQPGLSESELTSFLQKVNITLPPDVYALYAWRNGVDEDALESKVLGQLALFPLGIFIPFEIALDEFVTHTEGRYWDKNLFPLFGSGGGDYYIIDCQEDSSTFGMIYFYSPTNVDFYGVVTKFDSLNSLIITITECYNSNLYYIDEESYLEVDFKKERSISKKNNSQSNYWKILIDINYRKYCFKEKPDRKEIFFKG